MPFRRLRSLLFAAAACAALTGCNGGASALGGQLHPANARDAAFVRSMTDHETATLGITRLAQRRALRAELRGIARTMTTEQQKDLQALGSLARGPGRRGGRQAVAPRAPSSALADLARVKDATSFDYEFMRTMIEQNQTAIAIAHEEVSLGSDPETKHLAAAIESARKKELERIRAWLHQWYGGDIQPSPSLPAPGGRGGGGGTPSPTPGSPHKGPSVPL